MPRTPTEQGMNKRMKYWENFAKKLSKASFGTKQIEPVKPQSEIRETEKKP